MAYCCGVVAMDAKSYWIHWTERFHMVDGIQNISQELQRKMVLLQNIKWWRVMTVFIFDCCKYAWAGRSFEDGFHFEPACVCTCAFDTLCTFSVEADNDYASAAEIRLTGTKRRRLRCGSGQEFAEAAIAYARWRQKPNINMLKPIVKTKLDEALEAAETTLANAAA